MWGTLKKRKMTGYQKRGEDNSKKGAENVARDRFHAHSVFLLRINLLVKMGWEGKGENVHTEYIKPGETRCLSRDRPADRMKGQKDFHKGRAEVAGGNQESHGEGRGGGKGNGEKKGGVGHLKEGWMLFGREDALFLIETFLKGGQVKKGKNLETER